VGGSVDTLVACVGENDRRWLDRIRNLAISVRQLGGTLSDSPIIAIFADDVDPSFRSLLRPWDVQVRTFRRYDHRCIYFNKLSMLSLAEDYSFDVLLALDCDTVVTGDVTHVLPINAVGAVLDWDRPFRDGDWLRLYGQLGIRPPQRVTHPYDGAEAFPYYNSGVICVPYSVCRRLQDEWTTTAEDIWRTYEPPERYRNYAYERCRHRWEAHDQLAFTCALLRGGFSVHTLPTSLNYPTSFPFKRQEPLQPPFILHYRSSIDRRGFLRMSGVTPVDEHIEAFNAVRGAELGLPSRGPRKEPWQQRLYRGSRYGRLLVSGAVRTRNSMLKRLRRTPKKITHE
jgi:hypothetical protein